MARERWLSMVHDRRVPPGGAEPGPVEEAVVFDPWCPTCSSRVLLTSRRLLGLTRTPRGHRARLRCWCGTTVTLDVDRLGASRTDTPAPAPAPGRPPVPGPASVPGAAPSAA